MAPRPNWKGYLKLSLVSCPIALYPATSAGERISFRQINKKTGNRLRQQFVDDVTREPVDSIDKGRGYELAKGVFIQVEDEESGGHLRSRAPTPYEIDKFVPREQIDVRYDDSPYYIIPTTKSAERPSRLSAMRCEAKTGRAGTCRRWQSASAHPSRTVWQGPTRNDAAISL